MTRPPGARGSFELTRGIAATWWYTASAIVFFELFAVLSWTTWAAVAGTAASFAAVAISAAVWFACTIMLLLAYRHRDAGGALLPARLVPVLVVPLVCAGVMFAATGSWIAAVGLVAQSLALLNWQRGVRLRVTVGLTLLLVVLGVVDARTAALLTESDVWPVGATFAALLPVMTVTSLWWWDVLLAFDRARVTESRLAATQERLRVATDVHDLQGHHLQVIALQLELAEKLMGRDPDGALAQVRAARVSVAEATQGTRDLATHFRAVPLVDELANARDLLVAAGVAASSTAASDADRAPADVLGPVIRETTTNVLRHGGGRRARLALERSAGGWRYEIVNDRAPGAADGDGAGLQGIARRVEEAGGVLDVRRDAHEFAVVVTIPQESAP
ncbi:sensor histidine kinase [Microbacterium gilvum]|uniref:histidine kinase n=1 Tax=Microbacterium gilvum TaxID=1336204 RepID=A0ABP9A3B2_9MICO